MALTVSELDNMKVYDYLQHYKDDGGKECVVFPITRASNVIGIPKSSSNITDLKNCSIGLFTIMEENIDATNLNNLIGTPIF